MQKIILIGMRASGKTMLGQFITKALKADFFDLDQIFESREGITIKDFISKQSFSEFRDTETVILDQQLSSTNKKLQIIATGGGIIERESNKIKLKNHSPVIFIDRNFNDIIATLSRDKTRPSLTGKSLSAESTNIYTKRLPLYKALSDYTFSYSDSTEPWEKITERFLTFVQKII